MTCYLAVFGMVKSLNVHLDCLNLNIDFFALENNKKRNSQSIKWWSHHAALLHTLNKQTPQSSGPDSAP